MQFERVCPTCLLLLLQTLLNSPTQSWFGGAFNYYVFDVEISSRFEGHWFEFPLPSVLLISAHNLAQSKMKHFATLQCNTFSRVHSAWMHANDANRETGRQAR